VDLELDRGVDAGRLAVDADLQHAGHERLDGGGRVGAVGDRLAGERDEPGGRCSFIQLDGCTGRQLPRAARGPPGRSQTAD
jgi:hypothetical protein